MKKNILIIGASSKLAGVFLEHYSNQDSVLWLTYRGATPPNTNDMRPEAHTIPLDLSDEKSVNSFCAKLENHSFDAVINFSSTYREDEKEPLQLWHQQNDDSRVNALGFHIICKSLSYAPHATIIALGDSGLTQPKRNFGSYTLSKQLLHSVVQSLAIDLAPEVRVIEIQLGPTLSEDRKETYFDRCILTPHSPEIGLIELITFLIDNQRVFMTGNAIVYDGGSSLNRSY